MKILVNGENKVFDGNVIGLITELKENAEFLELWESAESTFDETDSTLDLEAVCIIAFLRWALELDNKPTKSETVAWLIEYLG